MPTSQLIIICLTILIALVIVARLFAGSEKPTAAQDRRLFAAQIAVALVAKLGPLLQTIAENTDPGKEIPIVATGPQLGSKVVVHKRDGQALEGLLVSRNGGVVLDDVQIVLGGQRQPVGGEWHLPGAEVSAIQVLA